ncbi:SIR2 family NAD-dependent protein deacylase [Paenibacillus sp. MAH-36]|uniref:protein acetyllysine N-acetyltransferase n=1 Tax=Paenibacillus violae TaxID=3077234 RepID=A0ABU3RNV4_9BACL|nr:Sir2 family NAD-dependent protein deacetylase [Paenibacillus sp. PFR10]MDU0205833.1 Sir2 family NAD-dependent protein deacetylase [Paenibacillus sp. PFR10]
MVYKEVAQIISLSSKMVVLTGAGCSVESGVPDFRSQSGWWKQIDPKTVATVKALESNYPMFHSFYTTRVNHLRNILPHAGHEFLARWEQVGHIKLIATQNVDGLHKAAGSSHVQELHGSIKEFRCHSCGKATEEEAFINEQPCQQCGGKLRPAVVLFGENLPDDAWERSMKAIEKADVVMVIGTNELAGSSSQSAPFYNKRKINLNQCGRDWPGG